jgi:hypothetical protein
MATRRVSEESYIVLGGCEGIGDLPGQHLLGQAHHVGEPGGQVVLCFSVNAPRRA